MKLYIVEDDPIEQRDLNSKLRLLGYLNCQFFTDVSSVKEAVMADSPDLIIIDIDLGNGENGITLSGWLDVRSIPYFFLSGKQDTTTFFKTAETRAHINIEKPISPSTLRNTIHSTLSFAKERSSPKSFEFLTINNREVKVPIADIEYLIADRSYCDLKRKGQTKLDTVTLPLQKLLLKLNHPHICRIHRSFAVNVNHVMQRSGNTLYIGEELKELDVSKSYKSSFEDTLNQLNQI